MGHFSPVDRDEIQETKPNGETCIVRDCRSFVDSYNFKNKANSHAFEVKIHTRQKLCHFGGLDAKAELFCQKSFVPVTGLECSYGKDFEPGYRDSFFNYCLNLNFIGMYSIMFK